MLFRNIRYVFFDLDGTLIDSMGIWNRVDEELYSVLGWDYPANGQQFREECIQNHRGDGSPYRAYCEELKARYGSSLSVDDIFSLRTELSGRLLRSEIRYRHGVPAFLKQLKADGIQTAVVSSTRSINLHVHRFENPALLAELPLDEYISLFLTGDDVSNGKPSPDGYRMAVDYFSAKPQDCLVIEDALSGVTAGKAAGLTVLAVEEPHAERDRERIIRTADAYFHSFDDILSAYLKSKSEQYN